MNDIFVMCPRCGKAVSKKDRNESFMKRYKVKKFDDHMAIPCIHCNKYSYAKEWKQVHDIPKIQLTDDLFEI